MLQVVQQLEKLYVHSKTSVYTSYEMCKRQRVRPSLTETLMIVLIVLSVSGSTVMEVNGGNE